MTDAVAIEPPDIGPGGSDESPIDTVTRATGMPSASLAICASIV